MLLEEWLLEWLLCDFFFSEKFLLRRQAALPGCTKEDYLVTEIQYLNSESYPVGREPFGDNENQAFASPRADGLDGLLSGPSSLTT